MKDKYIIKIFLIPIILISLRCSKNSDLSLINTSKLENALGITSSEVPFEGDYLFFKDVDYGLKERNQLDILLPQSDEIIGTVIFFHGGAFLFGTKEDLYDGEVKEIISSLLNDNIAVTIASISSSEK